MRILTFIKENETLKSKMNSNVVDFYQFPKNNEELDIISQFLAAFDIKSRYFDITLPTNIQDIKLLNFTKNIGKSNHVVKKININIKFILVSSNETL